MTYRIELTKAAVRDLTALTGSILKRVDACILGLKDDPLPPGVKKLTNSDGLYRVRVSDYRIIYRIEQDVVTVLIVRIGHGKFTGSYNTGCNRKNRLSPISSPHPAKT